MQVFRGLSCVSHQGLQAFQRGEFPTPQLVWTTVLRRAVDRAVEGPVGGFDVIIAGQLITGTADNGEVVLRGEGDNIQPTHLVYNFSGQVGGPLRRMALLHQCSASGLIPPPGDG